MMDSNNNKVNNPSLVEIYKSKGLNAKEELEREAQLLGVTPSEYVNWMKDSLGIKRLNNDDSCSKSLPITMQLQAKVPEKGPPKVMFRGYSGDKVSLASYGFDHPAVYNIENMLTRNKVPIKYRHGKEVGHTIEVRRPENMSLEGKGVLSIPNELSNELAAGMKNGFPYEASMGVDADLEKDIRLVPAGKSVKVNGRNFTGPLYVIENAVLKEMTITVEGRDRNTSFEFLNEESREMLKAKAVRLNNDTSADDEATRLENEAKEKKSRIEKLRLENEEADKALRLENERKEKLKAEEATRLENERKEAEAAAEKTKLKNVVRVTRLANDYKEHIDLVEKAIDEGWDDTRLENEVKLHRLNNNLPQLPSQKGNEGSNKTNFQNEIMVRLCLSNEVSPEFLEKKKFDKALIERCQNDQENNTFSFHESLVRIANEAGGNFTGFSDVDAVCRHIKRTERYARLENSPGFSTVTLSNLLEGVGRIQLEERWMLDPPFAPTMLDEKSNKDFRLTQSVRTTSGEPWEEVKDDGVIQQTTAGDETYYTTKLGTRAQILTLTRQQIINDDLDVMRDLMAGMVEGAMMIPDILLGRLMMEAAAAAPAFWVNNDNSFTSTALTRSNLSARWNAARTYDETRGAYNWTNIINDRWTLIVDPTKEETAWEIVKQAKFVGNTTANTLQGEDNFWYNKVDIKSFAQMANTSLFGSGTFVSANTWFLWPSKKRYSPFVITYLRGKKKPTIETIELESNILGVGWRGYWDVEVNKRERLAVVRANG